LNQRRVKCLSPLHLGDVGAVGLSDLEVSLWIWIWHDEVVWEANVTVREGVHDLLDHGLVAVDVLELRDFDDVGILVELLLLLAEGLYLTHIFNISSEYVILEQSVKVLDDEDVIGRVEPPHRHF
jgi:hypothetical protein